MSCQWPMWELVFSVYVANLGADQYRQRESATAMLHKIAPIVVQRLHVAERSEDREVATRARQILDQYYAANAPVWAANTLPSNYALLPWIAELPSEQPEGIGQFYLQRARRLVGMHGPPDWQDYRLATKMMIEDLYSQRVPRERIILILNQLAEVEREWIAQNGQRFDPPLARAK